MKASLRFVSAIAMLGLFSALAPRAGADLRPGHLRELRKIRLSVARVNTLLRRKDYDEAASKLEEAETDLKKVIEDAQVSPDEKAIADVQKFIDSRKVALEKARGGDPKGGNGKISFSKDVAPILNSNCVGCHANNPKGGLRLDTFAGMKKGGSSGALLVIKQPDRSLIMQRLLARGNDRMPKGKNPLKAAEIAVISKWIAEGAAYDAKNENTRLADLGKPDKGDVPVIIPKPTGRETVSFKDDIAPTIVNLCIRCHNDRQKRGGLSLVTFESMMRGGDSGRVIVPGNLEGSRLWALVGGGDQPRMPQGQARITRTFFNNLRKWFEEGNTYDGGDPRAALSKLVPTEEERRAAELAALSPEEFAQMRLGQGEAAFKKVMRKSATKYIQSAEFFVFGDLPDERLKQVNEWADTYADKLRKQFNVKDKPLWKGKLIIYVFRDRFGYSTFNLLIEEREVSPALTGHSFVTPKTLEQAYVALQDVGDDATSESPSLKTSLMAHMAGAFLQRGGGKLPTWVVRGTGLALAAQSDAGDEYLQAQRTRALEALKGVAKPEDIFAEGTFAPADVAAVGYTLVDFMLTRGGNRYGQFIGRLQSGNSVAAALKATYKADTKALALSYYANLTKKSKRRKR
jgi:hypothetical protein